MMAFVKTIIDKTGEIKRKLNRYLSILKIFVEDSIYRYKVDVFLVVLSSFMFTTLKIQAIGLAVFYARSMENNTFHRFGNYELEPRRSVVLLIVYTISIFLSLSLSAFLGYYSKVKTLKLWQEYEKFCSRRALVLISSNLRIWSSLDQDFYDEAKIQYLVQTDSRRCGQVLGMSLSVITPTITFIIATVTLLYIDIYLTLILAFFMFISSGFLYRINRSGVKHSALYKIHSQDRSREFKKIFNHQKFLFSPSSSLTEWINNYSLDLKGIKNHLDTFAKYLTVISESEFVTNLYFAIGTTLIILVLGSQILLNGEGLGKIIIYLIASRQGLQNFGAITQKATSINRFYPNLKHYFQFLVDSENSQYFQYNHNQQFKAQAINQSLILGSLQISNLAKGMKVLLITPIKLERYNITFFMSCLFSDSPEIYQLNSVYLATSEYPLLLNSSLRATFGFPEHYDFEDLLEDCRLLYLENVFDNNIIPSLDEELTAFQLEKINPQAKICFALIAALYSNNKLLFIDKVSFDHLTEISQMLLLDKFSDKIVVLVYKLPKISETNLKELGRYNEDFVAVTTSEKLLGIGKSHWLIKHVEAINKQLQQEAESSLVRDVSEDELSENEDF